MSMLRKVAAVSGVAVFALACGDGDGSSSSGVSGSKQLTRITDGEAERICKFSEDSYKASLTSQQSYCLRLTEPLYCEEDLEFCLGSDDYENELAEDWECEHATSAWVLDGDNCSATVAEYEACIRDTDAKDKSDFRDATCENLAELEDAYEMPASCATLFEKCPDADV